MLESRDDAFYYRSLGAQLERTPSSGTTRAKLFVERDTPAAVTTRFNIARSLGSAARFRDNVAASRGVLGGVVVRDTRSLGVNPQGWRTLSDVRLEGGWFAPEQGRGLQAHVYLRTSGDVTISRGFGPRTSAALTLGGGISDHAPVQRDFFLGGTYSVRGQLPGQQVGDAYWLSRLELGQTTHGVRPVVFGDVGWAGPRSAWKTPGRPMSGAGLGISFLDGLVRADLARGIYPRQRMRFDLYLDSRF